MRRLMLFAAAGASVGVLAMPVVVGTRREAESWQSHTPKDTVVERPDSSVALAVSPMFALDRLRRMMVASLPGGGCLVHSAMCLPEEDMARLLQDFGDVRIIVVPCDMHRLDAALWKARFPEALVVCPEGARKAWAVEEKVKVDTTYEQLFAPGNEFGIQHIPVPFKRHAEGVLVVPTKDGRHAWLVTDVLQNVDGRNYNWFLRQLFSAYGIYSDGETPTMSKGFRFMIGGSKIAKEFILSLDVGENDSIYFCHGEPILKNVKQKLETLANKIN